MAIASILPILCLSLYFFLISLNHIISFNGYAANGAFQLMNPLTRLAEGQVIGRDFPFFHGVGVALIHYPFFTLFGEGLFGSEMSRWFTSILLFIVSGFFFFYVWFYRQKDRLWLSLIAFAVTFTLTAMFAEVITPSNSLLGIRTVMPVLIALLILNRQALYKKISLFKGFGVNRFKVFTGFALAVAVLMGTEHGIAASIAYLLIEFGISVSTQANRKRKMRRFWATFVEWTREVIPTLLYLATSLLVISSIISHGHPFKLLKYSLITVPGDQFWYFGTEAQGYLRLDILFAQLAHPSMYPLYTAVVISAGTIWLAKRLNLLTRTEWIATSFLVTYGAVTLGSLLGYYSPAAQLPGMLRVFMLVDSLIITLVVIRLLQSPSRHLAKTIVLISLSCFALIAVIALGKANEFAIKPLARGTFHALRGDESELLGTAWKERLSGFEPHIEVAIKSGHKYPLWSTYSSLYENNNGVIHPSTEGCDYIIHCLGSDMREQYTKDFVDSRPELVVTLRQSYFGFEEWLWGMHPSFYEHLVENYHIIAENDAHILWKRMPQNVHDKSSHSLKVSGSSVTLPSAEVSTSRLIMVTIKYQTDPAYGSLPFISKLPRYIVRPEGTTSRLSFSLPPQGDTWSFLVVLDSQNQQPAYLRYYANGLVPNVNLRLLEATYAPIHINSETEFYFSEKSAFF